MVNQTGQCFLQLKVKTQPSFVLIWEDVKISSGKKPLKTAVEKRGTGDGYGMNAKGQCCPAIRGSLGDEQRFTRRIILQSVEPIYHAMTAWCKLESGNLLLLSQIAALHGNQSSLLVEIGKDERWSVKHSTPHSRHAYALLRAHYLADLQSLRAEQPLLEEESLSRFRKMHLPKHLLVKLHIYG